MPVLERKLQIPQAPRTPILPQAARSLDASAASLWLVHAPAGFGKTTLLADWARRAARHHSVAWLSLDRRDSKPRRLARGLMAALASLTPEADAQWQNLLETTESDDPDFLLEVLEGQGEALKGSGMLILDDLHLLAGSPAIALLTQWLEVLPSGLTLVLGARRPPEELPLARLRLQGGLRELGPDDLRWGPEEIRAFFAGLQLNPAQLAQIAEQAQGWALACQLLQLQLDQGVALERAIEQLGRHRLLEDYLQQEVLPFLAPAALDLLVQTSILTDLTPAACAALVPGAPPLDALARQLSFLTPLDRARHWYVCHPLLREWLQQRLEPEAARVLHAAAARHYLAAGAHESALEHAQMSEQPETLAEVLEALAQKLLGLGRIQTLQQAFEALPEAVLRQRPSLAMFQIWIWLLTGEIRRAQDWIDWLEQLPAGALPEHAGQLANLRGTVARRTGALDEMIACSEQALSHASADPFIPAVAWFNLGLALMQQEKWQQAEDAFHHAARWNRQAGNLITHYAARVCQARLFLRQGDLDVARRAYSDILASGRGESLQRHSLFGVVQIDMARIAYEQDEMEACETLLADGLELTKLSYNLDSVYGYVNALQIRLDAHQSKQAEVLLHEAMHFAQTRHLQSLWQSLLALRDRLDLQLGRLKKTPGGDAWNALYAALAQRETDKAAQLLTQLLPQHQGHRLQLVRLEMLQARLLELKGDATAARQQLLQALETAQAAPTFRGLLDEASPGMLAWMPSLLGGLKPGYRQRLLEALARRGFQPEAEALSERERELLTCLADGLNNKQLEEKLFISQNTIKTHLKNLYRKLGVGSRTAAIAKAREQGWL